MSPARWIGPGVLVLLLALLPLLPHRARVDDTIRTTSAATGPGPLTAGYGAVTPAFRRTIDRVVAAGATRTTGPTTLRASARALVDEVVRCATFEGQRYCLGTGWTDRTQAQVQDRAVALLKRSQRPDAGDLRTTTGDLSAYDGLRSAARRSPAARAKAERAELTRAARSVAKVWLIRHQVEGVPLPHDFFARHPEVRRTGVATRTSAQTVTAPQSGRRDRVKQFRDYPRRGIILRAEHVAQQRRTYWCGPTTMQMIGWAWSHNKRSQAHWASRLGTTTDGTAITSMVRVVNQDTGYDRESYAGPYITLDIGDWSFGKWLLLMARHFVDYHAPVVLHPVLLKRYFPYLDHDGSGHFQVGRGYRKRTDKTPLLGYFEPWNQQRFHPDEPYIARVQWRDAYRSYRANEAHFQHNLGV
jgi:Peptidase_C39 like family